MAVALLNGSVELLQLMIARLSLSGSAWNLIGIVDLDRAGYFIVATFSLIWLGSIISWNAGRLFRSGMI